MFDWPEASHTSPTRTSLITVLFTFIRRDSELAAIESSLTSHFPFASAVAALVCPAN